MNDQVADSTDGVGRPALTEAGRAAPRRTLGGWEQRDRRLGPELLDELWGRRWVHAPESIARRPGGKPGVVRRPDLDMPPTAMHRLSR